MILIKLVDARRGLNLKCRELFRNEKIAESIYRFLCDGIEECEDVTPDVPDRKVGKWIPGKELSREFLGNKVVHIEYENFTCSSCGFIVKDLLYHVDGSSFYRFCPNCGAEMKGEVDV